MWLRSAHSATYGIRDQWRRQDLARGGAQNYMKLFVVHKMTRNNT